MRSSVCENMWMTILLVFVHCWMVDCMHLSVAEDAELEGLIAIQGDYQKQITNLNDYAKKIMSQVAGTNQLARKISILEGAVQKQRQSLFSMKYNLIPSSTEPFIQCQIIADQEKQKYKQQIKLISSEIEGIEEIMGTIGKCDEIDGIQVQLDKIKKYLGRIQQILDNNCQQILQEAPHTFQSNLEAENWALGQGKTMENLINQYYQRAQKQSNITNCPLQKPFFSNNACIQCPSTSPVFDLSRNICMKCPQDQSLNRTTKQCEVMPKNSNYQQADNYVLAPLKLLPLPNKNLSTCEKQRPYWNGQDCIYCTLPTHYWNISESKCMECPNGQIFNTNNKKCVTKVYNKLTVLTGTDWVTNDGNITRVLSDRLSILTINQTTGVYSYCSKLQPYYDDIACIFCQQQFNLDTKKCVSAPKNLSYDKNVREYVVPQQNKQMDPESPNYITQRQQIIDNPQIPNCNQTHPYYDQVACIYCQKPFPIFNYDENTCVSCTPTELYNQTSHKCESRQPVYVKGNETYLLATDEVSIDDYKTNLYNSINQNPEKIPLQCKNSSQYAAIDKCVGCDPSKGEYFNVQTYECSLCDGNVSQSTHLCEERLYYLTNLQAKNIIFNNYSSATQKQQQQLQLERRQICPIDNPIQSENQTHCKVCPDTEPLFDYDNKNCTQCPTGYQFDQNKKKCLQIVYLTNLTKNVLVKDPNTIQKYINQQQVMIKNNITETCPQDKPYTNNNKLCLQCYDNFPLFDLETGLCTKCQNPKQYIPATHKCQIIHYLTNLSTDGLLEDKNYTVQNVQLVQDNIKAQKLTYQECGQQLPFGSQTGCIQCVDDNSYFNLSSKVCVQCPAGTRYWPATLHCENITYVTNISAAKNLIQDQNYTYETLKQSILKLKAAGPTQECPQSKPYKNPKQCIACPKEKPYFFLKRLTCEVCDNFKPENNTCPPKPLRYPNLLNYKWVSHDKTADEVIAEGLKLKANPEATECPSFYNPTTRDCINCSDGQYFNADNYVCETCPTGLLFDINIHKCMPKVSGHYTNLQGSFQAYLIYGGLTIGQLQAKIEEAKTQDPNSVYCPEQTPYYDTYGCIQCPKYKPYFNLRYELCQVCLTNQIYNPNTHNCEDQNGAAVWRKPSGELVYPYLFG